LDHEVDSTERELVLAALTKLEARVRNELRDLDGKLAALGEQPNVDVFRLTEKQLEHSVDLSIGLNLASFDAVILAGVLGRAGELKSQEVAVAFLFCEKNGDLQPWDREGRPKESLRQLYEPLGIRVLSNFDVDAVEGDDR
jgi:hypothetical protein